MVCLEEKSSVYGMYVLVDIIVVVGREYPLIIPGWRG